MTKNSLDNNQLDDLLTRSVETVYPSIAAFKARLLQGPIKIYLGIDPTGPSLHLGHAIPLKKLSAFQKAGHKIVLLIGDFTAMIGDPDKMSVRIPLTHEQVIRNATKYKEQASKFLDFDGENKAELKYNSSWFSQMNFADVLHLASHATVQEMLKRDIFAERVKHEKPVYIHEFMYPLMQGYDSVMLDVDAEIGGNDQTFNMLTGRDLIKVMKQREKFVLSIKLLTDPSGKKMGKTEGNMITLEDSPSEMFGKVMSWTDEMIIPGFELCTDLSMSEIEEKKKNLKESKINPFIEKQALATEMISFYYNKEEAIKALEKFKETFSSGKIPDNIEEIETVKGTQLINIVVDKKIVESKSEFRRLVSNNAVINLDTGENIQDPIMTVEDTISLRIGKKRFVKIVIERI